VRTDRDPPLPAVTEARIAEAATLLGTDSDGRETLRQEAPGRTTDSSSLPILIGTSDGEAPQLRLGDTLGEGGMGVVYAAVQTSLDRVVAVKTSRGETERMVAQMLREARITGKLEHPNVVPIHTLGRDETGRPLIVMKRIDGRPWTELLADVDRDEERASEDFLQRHLGILLQVAQALELAHSRRLLHRDIKPDNVMVGAFGEVYLVDWGIAVALDDSVADIPRARDITRVEGTPVYLAPEMAAGQGSLIDERADVYLLGATLLEVLTGAPPHQAPSLQAMLYRALASPTPEFPGWVPAPLAQITARALARDPADRYASAAEMAAAIREYLIRRGSLQLAAEAGTRADELEAMVTQGADLGPEVRQLFHEARFGFDQALASWPENPEAREGRRRLLETMVDLELDQGSPSAAQSILDTLESPPTALVERVAAARATERAEQERLRRLAHDANQAVGARTRRFFVFLGGFAWAATCIAAAQLDRQGILTLTPNRLGLIVGSFLVGTIVSNLIARREVLATEISRRLAYQIVLLFAAGGVLWPLLGALGLALPAITVVAAVVAAFLWAGVVINQGFPWLPQVLGQILIAVAAWLWPAYHLEIYGIIGGVQTCMVAPLLEKKLARSP